MLELIVFHKKKPQVEVELNHGRKKNSIEFRTLDPESALVTTAEEKATPRASHQEAEQKKARF